LASDNFLRDKNTVRKFRDALSKDELMDYLHMKCLNEVTLPIDAMQKKHLSMIGAHHNITGTSFADAEGLVDEEENKPVIDEEANGIDSDSERDFDETDENGIAWNSNGHELRTAHFNKMMYLKSFGIRFELPTAHIIDAAVFARDPKYIIQVVKYILPSERRTNIQIYPEVPLFKELN
jgi:hypothetical protein